MPHTVLGMAVVVLLSVSCLVLFAEAGPPKLRNVLLITVDDLRPQLGLAYGMLQTQTPNLDRLAKESLTFRHAYCQIAVCSPSRNSFMTGRRPDTTKVWNHVNHFRQKGVGDTWKTMPEYFKNYGYVSYGAGKLFHPERPPSNDFPASWTADAHNPWYWGNGPPIGDADGCGGNVTRPLQGRWGSEAVCLASDDAGALEDRDEKTRPQKEQSVEYDHRVATRTIENMRRAKQLGRPFFVAAGLRKPHLSWRTPRMFWDMYENITIDVAKHQIIGSNITSLAYQMNGELGQWYNDRETGKRYREKPEGPSLPEALQRSLRRGYYAAVSFLDFEVGRILDGLTDLGLADSTAVVLHGDHGFKLGEHGDWSKCTNWELDARVPLLVRTPWIPGSAGRKTAALVELVDLFPTVVELSGLPAVPASDGLEGKSFVPVITGAGVAVKEAAFSQYPRCPQYNMTVNPEAWECLYVPKENISRMGFSVRVANARYTQWRVWKPTCVADWTDAGLVAEELYDHGGDVGHGPTAFDDFEYINLAYDPHKQEQVNRLASLLKLQFDRHSHGTTVFV